MLASACDLKLRIFKCFEQFKQPAFWAQNQLNMVWKSPQRNPSVWVWKMCRKPECLSDKELPVSFKEDMFPPLSTASVKNISAPEFKSCCHTRAPALVWQQLSVTQHPVHDPALNWAAPPHCSEAQIANPLRGNNTSTTHRNQIILFQGCWRLEGVWRCP